MRRTVVALASLVVLTCAAARADIADPGTTSVPCEYYILNASDDPEWAFVTQLRGGQVAAVESARPVELDRRFGGLLVAVPRAMAGRALTPADLEPHPNTRSTLFGRRRMDADGAPASVRLFLRAEVKLRIGDGRRVELTLVREEHLDAQGHVVRRIEHPPGESPQEGRRAPPGPGATPLSALALLALIAVARSRRRELAS